MRVFLCIAAALLVSACAGQPTTSADVEIGVGTGGSSGSGAVGIRRGNVGVVIGR